MTCATLAGPGFKPRRVYVTRKGKAMTKLLDLFVMGATWYAEYQDGGFLMRGPTSFPAAMERQQVLAAIAAKSPDLEITPKAKG